MLMCSCSPRHELVIGTYGEHLYRCSFDGDNFTILGSAEAVNPSYALACDGGIFAVSEAGDCSGVYSFGYDSFSNTAERHQTGADPCFIMVYEGKYLMTADYSGGSVSVFPIVDGVLGSRVEQLAFEGCGPVIGRQESSHIHQLKVLPGWQEYILASDLGADVIRLIEVSCGHAGDDGIAIFEILQDGTLEKTGYARTARHPRNFMITADGHHLLVACRDDKVIQVFSIGPDGSLALQPARLHFDTDLPSSIVAVSR